MREPPTFDGCAALEFVSLDRLEGADHVSRLYVAIEGVNDRPVLERLRNNFTILNDYLPPDNNVGFGINFLITENEVRHNQYHSVYTLMYLIQVMDPDRAPFPPDFVGLAIVNATEDSSAGFWQYKNTVDAEWINITVLKM